MDFLFGQTFEIFLIVVLAAFTVLLFTGNGGFMLRSSKANQKKRTPEQERFLSRHLGVVTLLWMLAEIMLAVFGTNGWVTIAYIVILAISLVYLTKIFKRYD